MEVDPVSDGTELYVRNLEDVKSIIKHAKLDDRNLTQITQAVYYPDGKINASDLKLLELDNHLLQQIKQGQTIQFKGGLNDKVVLCTESKTYEVKEAEISNSLMLVPNFKFAQATSTSPLKSPKGGNSSIDRSLNDSNEEESAVDRSLERVQVVKIFHEYLECREIKPRSKKIGELLTMTRYSGPENEYCIDRKLLFTYEQLLDTVQCSRKEYADLLRQYRAIEVNGYMRILEYDYEYRILNVMLGLITENSWKLDGIDREVTIQSLEGIAPKEIVEGIFDNYTTPTENSSKFQYNEEMVARVVAQNILQPGLKFRIEEFLTTWQDALPEGMSIDESHLRGLGVVDRESNMPCVRSLAEEDLPVNLHDRLRILFKTKPKWTLDQLQPYLEYFTTPGCPVTTILAKHARSITTNGQRFYVSKHGG
ncbi:unnamed protein product [Hermetia illucens]|uniref:Sister chromatid cohesion protein DCC1 n=1 Tax=Hermetia illucens TaxID=343691 RepID=A0A7R8UYB6_HERIL|nr:sister chromatid cohesion protein DCC1 [Hermetia illucens]CAD7089395.1 unnamed protein product [Hermetia illucens]